MPNAYRSIRPVVCERARRRQAASTSQMARFETEVPTDGESLDALVSEREKCLLILKIVIESSKSPAMAVGTSSFGKSRDTSANPEH